MHKFIEKNEAEYRKLSKKYYRPDLPEKEDKAELFLYSIFEMIQEELNLKVGESFTINSFSKPNCIEVKEKTYVCFGFVFQKHGFFRSGKEASLTGEFGSVNLSIVEVACLVNQLLTMIEKNGKIKL